MDIKLAEKKIKTQQDFKGKFKNWNKLCNFLSVLRAIELTVGNCFTLQQSIDGLRDLISFRLLSKIGGLEKGEAYKGMGRYYGALKDKKLVCLQIGFMKDGVPYDWGKNVPDYQFTQLKWRTALGNQHWTLGDKDGQEIYDPWQDENDKLYEKVKLEKIYLLQIKEAE